MSSPAPPFQSAARQKVLPLVALLIVLPVFVVPASGGIELATPYSADLIGVTILPLSLLLIPLMLLLSPPRRLPAAAFYALLLFGVSAALGLILGLLSPDAEGAADQRLLRFAQTIAPTLYFILGYGFIATLPDTKSQNRAIGSLLVWCALFVAAFTLLYALDAALTGSHSRFGLLSDTIGPFANPKMKRFFPMLMAVSAVVLLGALLPPARHQPLANPWFAGAGAFLLLLALIQSWSRTALLAALVGLAIVFWKRGLQRSRPALAAACIAVPLLIAAALIGPGLPAGPTALGRWIESFAVLAGATDLDGGDTVRLDRIAMALEHGLLTPFGDGFRVRPQPNLDHDQMIFSENGWLDLAVRSGLIGTLCILYLVFRPLPGLVRAAQVPAPETGAALLLAVWVTIYGAGFFFLHLATELYFATLFWLLLGMVWAARNPAQTLTRTHAFQQRHPPKYHRLHRPRASDLFVPMSKKECDVESRLRQ